MSINDPLGDMLTRIRNAQLRYKTTVTTPASRLRERVLDVLAEEGYIRGYARVDYSGGKSEFEIELKYFDGEPVIKDIKRVSTPGRRVYSSVKDLPNVANGLGVAILSTPKGVMSDSRAPGPVPSLAVPIVDRVRNRPGRAGMEAHRVAEVRPPPPELVRYGPDPEHVANVHRPAREGGPWPQAHDAAQIHLHADDEEEEHQSQVGHVLHDVERSGERVGEPPDHEAGRDVGEERRLLQAREQHRQRRHRPICRHQPARQRVGQQPAGMRQGELRGEDRRPVLRMGGPPQQATGRS